MASNLPDVPKFPQYDIGRNADAADVIEVVETATLGVEPTDPSATSHPLRSVAEQVLPHCQSPRWQASGHANSISFANTLATRRGFFVARLASRPDQVLAFAATHMRWARLGRPACIVDDFNVVPARPNEAFDPHFTPSPRHLRAADAVLDTIVDPLHPESTVRLAFYATEKRYWLFRGVLDPEEMGGSLRGRVRNAIGGGSIPNIAGQLQDRLRANIVFHKPSQAESDYS